MEAERNADKARERLGSGALQMEEEGKLLMKLIQRFERIQGFILILEAFGGLIKVLRC
jgi:hypothetical protein